MNTFDPHALNPIVRAFHKARVSEELQFDFLQFLQDYPDYHSQALYLLNNKELPVEQVIFDLYGVPVKEQAHWKRKPQQEQEQNNLEVGSIPFSGKFLEKADINPKLLFKEWKQEHGFDSNLLEIGDVHTFISFERYYDVDKERKYKWSFSRARYGKGSWGNKRPIRSILKSLLDNNSNPGWVVRNFLEENKNFCNEENQPRMLDDIPNPMIFDSFDSHVFLNLVLGHRYLFFQGSEKNLQNAFTDLRLEVFLHSDAENYFLLGFLSAENKEGKKYFLPEEVEEKASFFSGKPVGLILGDQYYRMLDHSISFKMLQNLFHGVIVPKVEWEDFFALWQKHYPEIIFRTEPFFPDYTPILFSRNVHYWQAWLQIPENFVVQEKKIQKPKITLYSDSKHYQSNRISFTIEEFQGLQGLNPENTLGYYQLFTMIEEGLKRADPSNPNLISFERFEASRFLQLLEGCDFCWNSEGEPLFSEDRLEFGITVKKRPENKNQFYLQGYLQKQSEPSSSGSLEGMRAIGLVPAYFLSDNHILRTHTMQSARIINDSLVGVIVEAHEIGDFYSVALPFLRQREIQLLDPQGLLRVSALYNYKIFGHMSIWEVGGTLMGRLGCSMKTDIGDFPYILGLNQEEFTQKLDERRYQIPRNKTQESALLEMIYSHGWIDEGEGEYSMNEESATHFVLEILPTEEYRNLILYYGQKSLKKWRVKKIEPSFSTSIKTGIDWFDVNLSVEFEGQKIAIQKIIELWKLGQRNLKLPNEDGIVVIDRKWIEKYAPLLLRLVDSSKMREKKHNSLEEMNQQADQNQSLKVDNYYIGLLSELEAASKNLQVDTSWKEIANNFKHHQEIEKMPIPACIQANLRDYQKDGINWLCYLRKLSLCGILADDMGLGKTLQTLVFIAIDRENKSNVKPVLVIAPTSVVFNWQEEIKKFVPHFKTLVSHGPKRKETANNLNDFDIILTSYNLLQRDLEIFKQYHYSMIILDEAQMIKNSRSKNAQSVMELQSDHRLSLTGTPVENSVSELWAQFQFLMPGLLGNVADVKKKMHLGQSEKHLGDFHFIKRQTKPFILRRMKQNVVTELPQKIEQTLYCEMYPDQRKIYDSVLHIIRTELKQKIKQKTINQSRIAIFDGLLKLRQICCDPRLNNISGDNPPECSKFHLFLDTLSEIVEEGHRVLVFSQFVKMLQLMHKPLEERKIDFLQLDGGVQNRQELVNRFQNNDAFPVFLISLKAGGVGINLTAADYVIHYDPWWNPAVEAQATDRAYRIGQKNHVHVYKLITSNSIEEKILSLQKKKKILADQLIKSSNNIEELFELEDFQELFDL